MHEYLQVGKICNTHGVRGEVKVIPLTDNPERFKDLKSIFIETEGTNKQYDIDSVRYSKNLVLLKLKNIDSIDDAQRLKDTYIVIDRENAVKLPPQSYYICDLIGCGVYDEEGKKLGILSNVLKTGSNDVYIVRDENNKELLIPALKSVVKRVSIEDRIIEVELPDGL
ncbi:ribosome maturation factor RimM [Anaerobacterium chartisolvens]|nr:ribosome maturation factor RimM [Anaerobacterium chartisolvens]